MQGLTTFSASNFFSIFLPFKVTAQPPPLTTALRHYMTGPLFISRLRPCDVRKHLYYKSLATSMIPACVSDAVLTTQAASSANASSPHMN